MLKRAGKQFRRSLKTNDRKLAERRLAEPRGKVSALKISEDSNLTFEETAKRWLDTVKHALSASTVVRKETHLKQLAPFFAGTSIRNVTPRHCDRWVSERRPEIAPQTSAHQLEVMKAVLDFAVERGLILFNPAVSDRRKRILPAKIEVPTRDQFKELVAQIRFSDGRSDSQAKAKDGADLVEFLAYSGARLGEALAIRWQDVNSESNMIWIHGTKTDTSDRLIPMTTAFRHFLEKLKIETEPQTERGRERNPGRRHQRQRPPGQRQSGVGSGQCRGQWRPEPIGCSEHDGYPDRRVDEKPVINANPFAGGDSVIQMGVSLAAALLPLETILAHIVLFFVFKIKLGAVYWLACTIVRFIVG